MNWGQVIWGTGELGGRLDGEQVSCGARDLRAGELGTGELGEGDLGKVSWGIGELLGKSSSQEPLSTSEQQKIGREVASPWSLDVSAQESAPEISLFLPLPLPTPFVPTSWLSGMA